MWVPVEDSIEEGEKVWDARWKRFDGGSGYSEPVPSLSVMVRHKCTLCVGVEVGAWASVPTSLRVVSRQTYNVWFEPHKFDRRVDEQVRPHHLHHVSCYPHSLDVNDVCCS